MSPQPLQGAEQRRRCSSPHCTRTTCWCPEAGEQRLHDRCIVRIARVCRGYLSVLLKGRWEEGRDRKWKKGANEWQCRCEYPGCTVSTAAKMLLPMYICGPVLPSQAARPSQVSLLHGEERGREGEGTYTSTRGMMKLCGSTSRFVGNVCGETAYRGVPLPAGASIYCSFAASDRVPAGWRHSSMGGGWRA